MPPLKFLNIDREQWINQVDPEGKEVVDVSKVDSSIIRSLRSIFIQPTLETHTKKNTPGQGLGEYIDTAPVIFKKDKHGNPIERPFVLVVDEVQSSGRTLRIACDMMRRAFPEIEVAGTHWMNAVSVRTQGSKGRDAVGNADLPVWYHEDSVYGRGVNDRNPVISSRSPSATQRLGGLFLSTVFERPTGAPSPDQEGAQIRREIHALVQKLVRHQVRFVEGRDRPDTEENEDRMLRLNGVDSWATYRRKYKL